MSNDAPKSVVRRLFDAISAREVPRAADQLARSYRGVDATRSVVTVGRAEAEREIRAGLTAFPDLTLSIQECIAESSRVSVFWGVEAVHEGAFLNIPPTHQSVAVSGTGLFTVRDGRIVRGMHLWDLAGFLRAARLLPELPGDDRDTPSSSVS